MKNVKRIQKEIAVFFAILVERQGIGGILKEIGRCIKKIWKSFWKEIARILGILSREILKLQTPVVPNKIFFHTQETKYTCNPKYICEELLKTDLDVDIVWRVSKNNSDEFPEGVRKVRINSYQYFKEIFSSKIVITNSFLFLGEPVFLKKKQTLIETWHGSLGIKRHSKDAIKDTWRRVYALEKTGKMTSYCISNSSLETSSLRSTYWPKTPMLEYGHPRNDLFFENHLNDRILIRKQLFKKYDISPNTKIVMYAPTFRDNKDFSCYNIDFERLFNALEQRFGGTWCLFLRYHPALFKVYKSRGYKVLQNYLESTDIGEVECETKDYRRIINVTDYPDMQELIAVTDIAITDYSSWIYDFMLLRKPGFIFATDIAEYNNERGFYYPIETTPFSIAVNNDQLEKNILSFNEADYRKRLEEFLVEKGCVEDGHASERVVELIKKIISEENVLN